MQFKKRHLILKVAYPLHVVHKPLHLLCKHRNNYVVQFSDKTAVLGLLNKGSDTNGYRAAIEGFVRWCDEHHLQLNVKKN